MRGNEIPPVLRKIFYAVIVGSITYLVTEAADQPYIWGITLSAFMGGVTLVVQFLSEFEARLAKVEGGQEKLDQEMKKLVSDQFKKVNKATELFGRAEEHELREDEITKLVQNWIHVQRNTVPLIKNFAHLEVTRLLELLRELAEGTDVTYDGEDRDWLLELTRVAETSIDAASLSTVDAGSSGYADGGLWGSDLGQHYLDLQREAIQRGVVIRRIFILDRMELLDDPGLLQICRLHADVGVKVKILTPEAVPGTRKVSLFDFILFDKKISYEVTPASRVADVTKPAMVYTRLALRSTRVAERVKRFQDLWEAATDFGQLEKRDEQNPDFQ